MNIFDYNNGDIINDFLTSDFKNVSLAEKENIFVDNLYLNQLMMYSMVRFKWLNLPDDFDERFMELCLNFKGSFVAYKNKYDKLVVSDYSTNGKLNKYYYPTDIHAYSVAGDNEDLSDKEFVLCFNNYLMQPTIVPMKRFSNIIGDISRTLDVIINAEKVPYIFFGRKKIMLSFKNLFRKIRRNEPALFVDANIINPDDIRTLELKHQFNGVSIFELKRSYLNEALTFLGVDNNAISKRERVNSDESELANGINELSRQTGLRCRQEFCKKFNKMFNTNIDCVYYEDYVKMNGVKDDKEDEIVSEDDIKDDYTDNI